MELGHPDRHHVEPRNKLEYAALRARSEARTRARTKQYNVFHNVNLKWIMGHNGEDFRTSPNIVAAMWRIGQQRLKWARAEDDPCARECLRGFGIPAVFDGRWWLIQPTEEQCEMLYEAIDRHDYKKKTGPKIRNPITMGPMQTDTHKHLMKIVQRYNR